MNAEALAGRGNVTGKESNNDSPSSDGAGQSGRPEKPDNEKSDKTLANRQSM